ncbi:MULTISPECIES: hypothetical protein [unclassified Agrococcus]|uniref:hypothetical protein n=1 Tax=unclassified Agrococcus TaxID=2615065 RepID=UPI00361BECB2
MTSITVERTGFGIVVAEDGEADAAALLDGLPPLRAARYLTATPALRQALRDAAPEVVDAVLPHLDGTVVVPDAGLARVGDDGATAGSTRLAQALGVAVIAPEGRFIPCEGTLFSVGGGDGWIAQSPRGARKPAGRRYPAPTWQPQLPEDLRGAAHIPAGLWITAGAEPRHAVHLAGIAVRERRLLVVVGSPAEPAPTEERLLDVLRALPVETRSAVVLAGYGPGSLPLATARALAASLDHPLRIAHGVEIDGRHVRIDGDEAAPVPALALESVCDPGGTVTLERWATPAGLVAGDDGAYRLGETPRVRRCAGDRWLVHVVAAGIVVRSSDEPLVDPAELETPADSLGVFLQCDGAGRPAALPALLGPLLERLERGGPVSIHPVDAAARRVVRDAYPGRWAPTEALAITADGRLVAAEADASGDTDVERVADATDAEVVADAAVGEAEVGVDAPVGLDAEVVVAELVGDAQADGASVDPAASQLVATTPAAERATRALDAARHASAAHAGVASQPTTSEPRTADVQTTVAAVVGGDAEERAPRESAGAARRRARDAEVTNVRSADDAAAAWYAAALPRRVAEPAEDAGSETPSAPPAPAARAAEPAAPPASPTRRAAAAAAPDDEPVRPTRASSAAPIDEPARPARGAASAARIDEPVRPVSAASAAQIDAPARAERIDAGAARSAQPASTPGSAASDALTRALQGSAVARSLGVAARATVAPANVPHPTDQAPAAAEPERDADDGSTTQPTTEAAAPASGPVASEPARPAGEVAEPVRAARVERSDATLDVPAGARSTAEQRHRVRTALGSRYDVASRTVSQLLAQQPGMRVASGDRSAMLTGLSLVRVFATDPHGEYDLDFHTCLAEGLAMLPTARSVVVRGIPVAADAATGSTLRLRVPLVAAAADGPAAGPSEALIWTTSGRRLDRVLHGAAGAADVVLPAGARLRVLGSVAGSAPRLLLAEEGTDAEQALARLQAVAEARGDLGAHAHDRWLGDLPLAA